ncbi:MAG TPA: hypothetical protein VLA89_01890 [Gemmatimonadales bacterium]|nr:hypothetical protein [Gemmatimonadales bacterium]
MTLSAGYGLVLSLERKLRLRVLRHAQLTRTETGNVMARGTVHRDSRQCRGATVRIGMTRGTGGERRPLPLFGSEIVALRAGDGGVPAAQGIPGAVVIERLFLDGSEAPRGVAAGTGGTETPGVRIRVARRALLVGNRAVSRYGVTQSVVLEPESGVEVTLATRHLGMLSGEWVGRRVVRESGGELPLPGIMAPGTVLSQGASMNVLVARHALPRQSGPALDGALHRELRGR